MSHTATGKFLNTIAENVEAHRAMCFGCRARGPLRESPALAHQGAESDGWQDYAGHLFCQKCRHDKVAIIRRREQEALLGLEDE